jgi:hypothetical protein
VKKEREPRGVWFRGEVEVQLTEATLKLDCCCGESLRQFTKDIREKLSGVNCDIGGILRGEKK